MYLKIVFVVSKTLKAKFSLSLNLIIKTSAYPQPQIFLLTLVVSNFE